MRVAFLGWLAVEVSMAAGAAGAQNPGADVYPMPVEGTFSDAEVAERFVRRKAAPFGAHELAYSILVPKGWSSPALTVRAKVSTERLVPLGLFVDQRASNALIEVSYLKIVHDMPAEDWLRFYCLSQRMRMIRRRIVRYRARVASEALVERLLEGGKALSRISVSQDGDRLFVVSCTCAASDYRRFHNAFGLACASFALANPSQTHYAEKLKTVEVDVNGGVCLRVPASWEATEETVPAGMKLVRLLLKTPAGARAAMIQVKVCSRTAFPKLTVDAMGALARQEVTRAGKRIAAVDFTSDILLPNLRAIGTRTGLTCLSGTDEYDVQIAALSSAHHFMSVTMIAPAPGAAPPSVWMRAKRAMQIALHESSVDWSPPRGAPRHPPLSPPRPLTPGSRSPSPPADGAARTGSPARCW